MGINKENVRMALDLSFIDDHDKMVDFLNLSKDEFLQSYSYMTEEEYDATQDVIKFIEEVSKFVYDELWRRSMHRDV